MKHSFLNIFRGMDRNIPTLRSEGTSKAAVEGSFAPELGSGDSVNRIADRRMVVRDCREIIIAGADDLVSVVTFYKSLQRPG